jgi:hypothetical protein
VVLHRRGARFAGRRLNNSPPPRYLTNAVFPYYIVHQTTIILIARALKRSDLSYVRPGLPRLECDRSASP